MVEGGTVGGGAHFDDVILWTHPLAEHRTSCVYILVVGPRGGAYT